MAHSAVGCGYGYYTLWTRRAAARRTRALSVAIIDQVRAVKQFRLAHVETFALELGQYNARGEFKTDFRCITMDSAMPRAASPPVHSTISMVPVERLPGEINPLSGLERLQVLTADPAHLHRLPRSQAAQERTGFNGFYLHLTRTEQAEASFHCSPL
jgi:hypothetical protein